MATKGASFSIWAALIAVYVAWGSTYLAIRFAVETIPPYLMAGIRFLAAGAILYVFRRAVSGDPRPRLVEWRSAAVVGLLLLAGANGFVSWAEQEIPSGIAALLVSGVPLWMVVIDMVRPGGERPGRQSILGVLIGFAGTVLLIGPEEILAGRSDLHLAGVGALLLAGFLWAGGSLFSRKAPLPDSALLGTGMEMLVGGAGLVLIGTVRGEWGALDLALVTATSWLGLAYLIVFGSLIGFAAYTWLLRNAPTPLVSTYAYVNPLIAVMAGYFLAQETLNLRILLATGIIIGSVAVINTARATRPKAALQAAGSSADC